MTMTDQPNTPSPTSLSTTSQQDSPPHKRATHRGSAGPQQTVSPHTLPPHNRHYRPTLPPHTKDKISTATNMIYRPPPLGTPPLARAWSSSLPPAKILCCDAGLVLSVQVNAPFMPAVAPSVAHLASTYRPAAAVYGGSDRPAAHAQPSVARQSPQRWTRAFAAVVWCVCLLVSLLGWSGLSGRFCFWGLAAVWRAVGIFLMWRLTCGFGLCLACF